MNSKIFESQVSNSGSTCIKVIGAGGAGSNAINRMIERGLRKVQLIAANTDVMALNQCHAQIKLPIGSKLTSGLGSGDKPEVGEMAAAEDREMIADALKGADMVFVTAGMGGGTGTGAAPVIARVAREQGALTVGMITTPLNFEGGDKMRRAEKGIAKMREAVDILIVFPNELMMKLDKKTSIKEAFCMADDILCHFAAHVVLFNKMPLDGHIICDIGAEFAAVAVVTQGYIAISHAIRLGGDDLDKSIIRIIDAIKEVLSRAQKEPAAAIGERSIVLTGGDSRLRELIESISQATGVPVLVDGQSGVFVYAEQETDK